MLRTRCDRVGLRSHTGVRESIRQQRFVCKSGFGGFPEGGRIITMADRYQDRRYPADDGYDRGDDQHGPGRAESDPLAELARLIGQTDPFATSGGRANQPVQPRSAPRETYYPPAEADDSATGRSRRPGCSASRDRKRRRRIIRQDYARSSRSGLSERGASAAPLRGPASRSRGGLRPRAAVRRSRSAARSLAL